MIERGLEADYELVATRHPSPTRPASDRCGDRWRSTRLLARGGGDPRGRLPTAGRLWARLRPGCRDSSSCGTRRGRSRRSATAASGKLAAPRPVCARPQELHARDRQLGPRRAVLRGGVRDPGVAGRPDRHPAHGPVLRRAAASGRPGGRARGVPDDRTADTSGCSRRRSAATPGRRRTTCDRIDFAGAPRAGRGAGRGRASSRCTRSCASRSPIPERFSDRLVDGTRTTMDVNDLLFVVDLLITDYSSIVFEFSVLDRPMLFFAYDLDEYIAERDFYVPFEAFVPGPHRADLRRAARRDPARGLRGREGRRVRGGAISPTSTARDGPRHRRAGPRPLSGVDRARSARSSVRVAFAARPRSCRSAPAWSWPPRTTTPCGAISSSSATRCAPPTRRSRWSSSPTPRAATGAVGSGALWSAAVAGYHLATARLFIVDDYYFPLYVDPAARRAPPSSRRGTPRGVQEVRLQRPGQVVRRDRGPDAPGPHPQQLRHLPRRLDGRRRRSTPKRSGSRSSASATELGIPRTDALFETAAIARTRAAVRARYGIAADRRRHPVRPDVPRRQRRRVPSPDRCWTWPRCTTALGDDHVLLLRLHPFVRAGVADPAGAGRRSPSTPATTPRSTTCCSRATSS